MKNSLTVSINGIFPLIQYLKSLEITDEMIFLGANIDPQILKNPDSRLTLNEMDRIYEHALLLTEDENLGLHAGEFMTPGSNHIVGYIMMNCSTVREAYEKLLKYLDVSTQGIRIEVIEKEKTAQIKLGMLHPTPHLKRHHYDFILTVIVKTMPQLCGKNIKPIEINIAYKAPNDISEHHRIFDAPINFDSQTTCIVCDKKYLDLPVVTPNPQLLSLLEKHAEDILSDILPENTESRKVRRLLAKEFQGNSPKIDIIAKKMGMSVRKLQLLLKTEGTSYSKISEDVRKKLAIAYLQENRLSVDDIAYLLGFSEPSAFYRTFKRWTNRTPGEYRDKK